MIKNSNYNRLFIMMREEDKGFGKSGKPTGYLKLEIKDNKGKALVHVQNIGLIEESKVLKAYLLSSLQPKAEPLYLGTIELKGGNGDLTHEFSKNDLQKIGVDPAQLDTVVVTCKDTIMENGLQTFPLAGFKTQSWNWKGLFMKQPGQQDEEMHEKGEAADEPPLQKEERKKFPIGFVWNTGQDSDLDSDQDTRVDTDKDKDAAVVEGIGLDSHREAGNDLGQNNPAETPVDEVQSKNEDMKLETGNSEIDTEHADNSQKDAGWEAEQQYIEKTLQAFNENYNVCNQENRVDNAAHRELSGIIKQLSRYMKQEEPFANGDMGYRWWILNDCSFILNNIYSNYNTAFFLYNPYVMNTVHRYGHYLFGVKEDKERCVQYISYAIPSRYGVEPHPLLYAQAYAYWIPKKGEKSAIGAQGYWVISIDVKSGEIVSVKD